MEMRHDSYGLVQCCNVHSFTAAMCVTKLKKTENAACNRSFGKRIFSPCDDSWERKFVYCSLRTRFAMIAMRLQTKGVPLHYRRV